MVRRNAVWMEGSVAGAGAGRFLDLISSYLPRFALAGFARNVGTPVIIPS
jgi:hypothetical protein